MKISDNTLAVLAIFGLGLLGGVTAGLTFFGLAWWMLASAAS